MTTLAAMIDWGSVADWVSGLGSFGAVLAALVIARSETKRADRAERTLRQARSEELYETRNYISHIANPLIAAGNFILRQERLEVSGHENWKRSLKATKERAIRVQAFPQIDLRSYLYLDRIIAVIDSEPANAGYSLEMFGNIPSILHRLERITTEYQLGHPLGSFIESSSNQAPETHHGT